MNLAAGMLLMAGNTLFHLQGVSIFENRVGKSIEILGRERQGRGKREEMEESRE